jgi:hypothetical protein
MEAAGPVGKHRKTARWTFAKASLVLEASIISMPPSDACWMALLQFEPCRATPTSSLRMFLVVVRGLAKREEAAEPGISRLLIGRPRSG